MQTFPPLSLMKYAYPSLLALCAAALLTSCGDDHDESSETPGGQQEPSSGQSAAAEATPSAAAASSAAATPSAEASGGAASQADDKSGDKADVSNAAAAGESGTSADGNADAAKTPEEVDPDALLAQADELLRSNRAEQQAQALPLLRRAAEAGQTEAAFRLGFCYANGIGTQPQADEARKWLSMAAEKNHPSALAHLGLLCDKLSKDETVAAEALGYYRRAAELGQVEAQVILAYKLAAQPESQAEALEWLRKAAAQKNDRALCALGVFTLEGRGGLKADPVEAYRLFEQAAELGSADGLCNQAYCLERGLGVKADPEKAVELYTKLLEKAPLPQALYNLALCRMDGRGTEKDSHAGVQLLVQAYNAGHVEAACELARCCAAGIGLQKNEEQAVQILHEAARRGSAEAQYTLACCYREGKGVKKDETIAETYLKAAAANGHPKAVEGLKAQ